MELEEAAGEEAGGGAGVEDCDCGGVRCGEVTVREVRTSSAQRGSGRESVAHDGRWSIWISAGARSWAG